MQGYPKIKQSPKPIFMGIRAFPPKYSYNTNKLAGNNLLLNLL